jgi:hypothetical protein
MNKLCKTLLGLVLVTSILSARNMDVTEDVKVKPVTNIIYQENADNGLLFKTYVSKQTTTKYGITKSALHFDGDSSARFELRDTDPMNNNGTRAEITFPTITNMNRWYSFAVYFPSADYKYDSKDEVINQWHQGGGATPALCIRTKKDRIYLRVMGDKWIDLGLIEKDKWRSYVLHIQHASNSTGLVEIWKDNVKILNYKGQNMYSVGSKYKAPNWKLGIYKSNWNDSETTMTKKRVIYFDDIKFGNENTTYTEMVPTK